MGSEMCIRDSDNERKQLLQRLEDQRTQLGNEIKELRDRNAAVSHTLTGTSLVGEREGHCAMLPSEINKMCYTGHYTVSATLVSSTKCH